MMMSRQNQLRIIKMTFPLFSLAVSLVLGLVMSDSAGCKEVPAVGGKCVYKVYKGTAVITEVSVSDHEGNKGQRFCRVKFVFTSSEPIKEPFAQVEDREFDLVSSDFSSLSESFLHKYRIKQGSIVNCDLHVITQGTCTPVLFEFPELNRDEYTVK